jgi:anion-transporting  ArsA/GET3 family ATPase
MCARQILDEVAHLDSLRGSANLVHSIEQQRALTALDEMAKELRREILPARATVFVQVIFDSISRATPTAFPREFPQWAT